MDIIFPQLISWLNSKRSFKTGLELYKKYGTNQNLIRRFERTGDNQFNKSLLFEQIKEMAKTLEASATKKKKGKKPEFQTAAKEVMLHNQGANKTEVKVVISNDILPKAHATTTDSLSDVDFALLPDKLKKLSTLKGDLYREASRLHRELEQSQSKEESAEKCETIINNMKENDLIYKEIRHYLNHKTFLGQHPLMQPQKEPDTEYLQLPADKLIRAIASKSAHLSRIRKWLKENPKHAQFKKKKASAADFEALIKKMREQLNAIQSK